MRAKVRHPARRPAVQTTAVLNPTAVTSVVSEHPASSSTDPPPLPPPCDPPAPVPAKRRRFANPNWEFPGGWLVLDVSRSSLDAHCSDPRHYDPKNPCRLNRGLAPKSDSNAARGRPLGLLVQWLKADVATSTLHKDMLKPSSCTLEDVQFLCRENRVLARDEAQTAFPGTFQKLERKLRDGEGEEPIGFA